MGKNIIWILIILGAALGFVILGNRRTELEDITKMCVQHYNLGMHIHPHLKIVIKGVEQPIPADIGIVSPLCYRPIHTHDASGNTHLEFPKARDVRLADFFTIWGKTFNSNQIFDFTNGPDGQVKMFVNGQKNAEFENYIMKDQDEILIIYDSML